MHSDHIGVAARAPQGPRHSGAFGPSQALDATLGQSYVAFGVTAEIFSTADYPLTQRWAAALRAAGYEGVRYWARHDLEHARRCVALFGAGGVVGEGHRHVVMATAALSERADLLERWREETGVTILDVPDLL